MTHPDFSECNDDTLNGVINSVKKYGRITLYGDAGKVTIAEVPYPLTKHAAPHLSEPSNGSMTMGDQVLMEIQEEIDKMDREAKLYQESLPKIPANPLPLLLFISALTVISLVASIVAFWK
jgi:hypothetical protein